MDQPPPLPNQRLKSKRFSKTKTALISIAGVILLVVVVHLIATRDIAPIDDSDLILPTRVSDSDLNVRELTLDEGVIREIKSMSPMAKNSLPIDQKSLSSLISKCDGEFKVFDQLAESANWKFDGEILINSPHPEVYSLRSLARLRELEIKSLWNRGENDLAINKAVSLLKLGKNIQNAEGSPLHQIVGLSIVKMGQTSLAEFIQEQHLSNDQLEALFADIAAASFDSEGFQKMLAVDYNSQKALINDLAAGKIDFDYMSESGSTAEPNPKRPNPLFFKKNKTIALYADGYRNVIAEAPLFPANSPNLAEQQAIEIRIHFVKTYLSGNPVGRLLYSMTIPAISGIQTTNLITRIQHDILRLQIAAERYRLKNGEWPEDLAALIPEFIDSVPVDLMDGQPLRYNSEKLRIYSIGKDLIDADGDVRQDRTAPFKDYSEPMVELERTAATTPVRKDRSGIWDIKK